MLFLYKILSYLLYPALVISSSFSSKLNQFLTSRKLSQQPISKGVKKRILIHCASLGEYEQGKTIAKQCYDLGYEIVVSFFSPSGYEYKSKNKDQFISQYVYLPLDTPTAQANFLRQVQPDIVIIIKSEFWFCFINELTRQDIPFLFVSMYLTDKPRYFKWPYRSLLKNIKSAQHFFVQDNETKKLLTQFITADQISISGDNRIETIFQSSQSAFKSQHSFKEKTIIYGSVYADDIDMIKSAIQEFPEYEHFIAPHDLSAKTLEDFKHQLKPLIDRLDIDVILFEEMGQLKYLYRHAQLAYIGGGFQNGLHNALEALVYEIPVIIGPKFKGFPEINELADSGYIEIIQAKKDLNHKIEITIAKQLKPEQLKLFFESNANNSSRIVAYIQNILSS